MYQFLIPFWPVIPHTYIYYTDVMLPWECWGNVAGGGIIGIFCISLFSPLLFPKNFVFFGFFLHSSTKQKFWSEREKVGERKDDAVRFYRDVHIAWRRLSLVCPLWNGGYKWTCHWTFITWKHSFFLACLPSFFTFSSLGKQKMVRFKKSVQCCYCLCWTVRTDVMRA